VKGRKSEYGYCLMDNERCVNAGREQLMISSNESAGYLVIELVIFNETSLVSFGNIVLRNTFNACGAMSINLR